MPHLFLTVEASDLKLLSIENMKSYLRYEPKKSYGVIASPQCNVTYDCSGNLAISGALQEISLWNLRQANQVMSPLDQS